jgi:O-Antigen ligase
MSSIALSRRSDQVAVLATVVVAAAIGLLVVYSPLAAGLAVVTVCAGVTVARFGVFAITLPALALLPWLVLVEGVAPRMLGTFTTAVAAGGLLVLAMPLQWRSRLVPAAALMFIVPVIAHALFATNEDQLIVAAKYLIFPAIALAVSSVNAGEALARLRRPVLISCLVALSAHIVVIALGLGKVGTYYDVGERLGYAAEIPHALALLGMVVAGAGLTMPRVSQQIGFFAAGAIPAAMTAVRSALLAFAVMFVVFFWKSNVKARTIALLAVIAVVAVASGAADVITNRLDSQAGEFATFSSAGSGRGLIWTVALNGWIDSGLGAWIYGAGLRAAVDFEIAALAVALVGHSDVVEVIVQLGVIGLAAWLALWVGLLRSGLSPIIVLPMIAFGVVNGSLEYLPSLAVGLFLAAACGDPVVGPRRPARVRARG